MGVSLPPCAEGVLLTRAGWGGGLPSRPILNAGANRPASPGGATSIPSRVSRSTSTFASRRTSGTPTPRSAGRRREFEAEAVGALAPAVAQANVLNHQDARSLNEAA